MSGSLIFLRLHFVIYVVDQHLRIVSGGRLTGNLGDLAAFPSRFCFMFVAFGGPKFANRILHSCLGRLIHKYHINAMRLFWNL